MTVSKEYNKHIYEGNGLTRDWPYNFDLPITAAGAPDTSLIHVFRTNLRGEVSEVTTGYSINAETGTLTCPTSGSPLETGEKLTILRLLDVRQQFFDPSNQANLYPETLEDNTDRLVMMIQQIDEEVGRAVTMGEGYEGEEVTAEGLLEARDIALSAATASECWANTFPAIADELDVNIVRDEADLRAKLAAIGASNASLVIATTIPIADDLTIPSNVALSFKRPGQLQPAVGTTLTINGPIDAGLWQIFGTSGVVSLRGALRFVYPRWFGADGRGIADDSAPFRAALRSLRPGHTLYITPGEYNLQTWTTYTLQKQIVIQGIDRKRVTLVGPGSAGGMHPFLNCDKSLEISGITFTEWNGVILAAGDTDVDFITLEGVGVTNSKAVVSADDGTIIDPDEDIEGEDAAEVNPGNRVGRFTVKKSVFSNIGSYLFWIDADMDRVEITDCEMRNIDRYVFRNLTAFTDCYFTRNRVVDVHSPTATGASGVVRVLQVWAENLWMLDNHFENLSANVPGVNEACTGNTVIIYSAVGGSLVATGNVIKNCGDLIRTTTNGAGLFHSKRRTRSTQISGNTFDNPDVPVPTNGISAYGDMTHVSDNIFTNWTGCPIYTIWVGNTSLTITGNLFRGVRVSTAAITLYGNIDTALIANNAFDDITAVVGAKLVNPCAVEVTRSSGAYLAKSLAIKGNHFGTITRYDGDGNPVPGSNAAINLLTYISELPLCIIEGNTFKNDGYALSLRTKTSYYSSSIGRLSFCDNVLEGSSEVASPIYMPDAPASLAALHFKGNKGKCQLRQNGSAQIENGSSSVTVTHGLHVQTHLGLGAPDQIQVTPLSSDGVGFWISDVGTDTFKINLSGTAASTVPFLWAACGERD